MHVWHDCDGQQSTCVHGCAHEKCELADRAHACTARYTHDTCIHVADRESIVVHGASACMQ